MKKVVFYGILSLIGIIMVLTCTGIQISNNIPLFKKEEMKFTDSYGNRIACTYYSFNYNSHNNKGIMLFHGFAEDQYSMKSYADSFLRQGYLVFTVDFAGHGQSSGLFTLRGLVDNLTANEVILAKEQFKKATNLSDDQIYMVGHSLGGRAILKAATIDVNICAGIVIIGSPVNLENGYMENSEWLQNLSPTNPATNISIITSNWDDVLPTSDAIEVFETLTGLPYNTTGNVITSGNNIRELIEIKTLFHTYEVISPRAIAQSILSIAHFSNEDITKNIQIQIENHLIQRMIVWLLIPIGLFYFVIFGIYFYDLNRKIPKNESINNNELTENNNSSSIIKLESLNLFFSYKPLIILGSFFMGGIYATIFLALPFGVPTFTLIYACPIAGYGSLMLMLFTLGKVPGISGKWQVSVKEFKEFVDWKKPVYALLIGTAITGFFAYSISSNWNFILVSNEKIYWLVLLSLLTSMGFYAKRKESELIKEIYPDRYSYIFYNNLIFLSPFILVALALLIIGVYFLFIDAFHGFAIFTLVVLSGGLIQRLCKNTYFTALLQSIMLMFLVLPRSPLMSFFY